MAKQRLKDEWKMWIGLFGVFLAVVAFLYLISRPPMEGGEYQWQVIKITEDGNLSLKGSGKTLEFKLAALEIPEGQSKAVKDLLSKSLQDKWVRIRPVRDDAKGVKEGFVYLEGEDIHARIIRQGLAKIDKNEKSFDVRDYVELELEAKKGQRGIWRTSEEGVK